MTQPDVGYRPTAGTNALFIEFKMVPGLTQYIFLFFTGNTKKNRKYRVPTENRDSEICFCDL